jgi:hypothetical protein
MKKTAPIPPAIRLYIRLQTYSISAGVEFCRYWLNNYFPAKSRIGKLHHYQTSRYWFRIGIYDDP